MDKEKDDKKINEEDLQDDIVLEEEEGEDPINKIKKLKKELLACKTERQEYLDGWQRAKADYLNLKKDEETKRKDLIKFAKEDLLLELLQIADSFEMAFANKEAWLAAPENWRKGVEYIYSQLTTIFKYNNLLELNPVGQKFNPENHYSIATIPTEDETQDGLVLEVVKKGYTLNDKTIRPAQVKVGEKK